ncbi:hypothetical protein BH24BAC1_BH24BAC1_10920 [soil metagenome]
MATTTATIFVGHAHQNGSGINPTHFIQFTENDRPALILRDIEGKEERKVIIPTVENTIEDIFLLITVFILKMVKPSKEIHNFNRATIYDILDENERKELYKKSIDILKSNRIKVVINILDDSHLLSLIEQIKKYPNDYEITMPSLKKEFNAWSNKVEL